MGPRQARAGVNGFHGNRAPSGGWLCVPLLERIEARPRCVNAALLSVIRVVCERDPTVSQGTCTFEYLPLKVGETTGKLTLQSSDLGTYQYELHLVATPAPPERAVHFTTMLGSGQQQPCRFTSYSKGRTEYACKVRTDECPTGQQRATVVE